MHVHPRAQVALRTRAIGRRFLVLRGIGDIAVIIMVVAVANGMIVEPVAAMRVHVEGRQRGRIAVQAAGADRDGNHEKAQKLASQLAHTQEKPKDSSPVK